MQVPASVLQERGAVSEAAALAMARGARETISADIAMVETSIAGPGSGGPDQPVGTVGIACAGLGDRAVVKRQIWDAGRTGNKRRTAQRALELVRNAALDQQS